MARLRQVASPAQRGNWVEYFYSGQLQVVNGETETENQEWINQLLGRGFQVIEETPTEVPQSQGVSAFSANADEDTLGEVRVEESAQPLGTQIANEIAEVPSENEVMAGETATASDDEAPVTDAEGNVQVGVDEASVNDDAPHSESVVPSRSRRKKE